MMPNNGECSKKFSAGAGTGFLGTLKMCVRQPAWWCLGAYGTLYSIMLTAVVKQTLASEGQCSFAYVRR